MIRRGVVLAIAAMFCLPAGIVFAEQTVGDKFRKVIAEIDARCKREKRGPYLDPEDPEYRKKVADTSCDILKLKPRDWRGTTLVKLDSQVYPVPEDWLSSAEGRFAHSLKLPPPYDKPKYVYREGMTSAEYFEALCREEAGEFVFKSLNHVDVIFEFRPRDEVRTEQFHHLYSIEDPYGYVEAETRSHIGATWTGGNVYRALERRTAVGFERLFRRSIAEWKPTTEAIEAPIAAYGFAWRGIVRPRDRDNGIAGGELIAIDRNTQEVLGFRRGFIATGVGNRGVSWEFAAVCPKQTLRGGRSKDFDFGLWFVTQVLQPTGYEAYRRQISGK